MTEDTTARTNEPEQPQLETRRLMRMLAGLSKAARDASLTGQLAEGKGVAVRQYNAVLARLLSRSQVPDDLFTPLPDDASFDDVGVAAMQLHHFLRDEEDEERRRRARERGSVFEEVRIGNIPGQISDLGEMVREYLPDLIKSKMGAIKEQVTRHPKAPGAAPEQAPPMESVEESLEDVEERMGEIAERMIEITEQLAAAGHAPEQVQQLSDEMARLGQEQADLARRKAVLQTA